MMMIVILVYCVVSVLMPTRPSLHLAFFAPPSTPLLTPPKTVATTFAPRRHREGAREQRHLVWRTYDVLARRPKHRRA